MNIQSPYLLFIGDAKNPFSIKLANSIADWRPELAIGEFALPGCEVTTSLPRMDIKQAYAKGARTFVLGFANSGGTIDEAWLPAIVQAIEVGMDIASGLHQRLDSFESIRNKAANHDARLIDVRHSTYTFKTGTGKKRAGKRLLTVGTDCSSGKMYTALAIEKELHHRQITARFVATGQCGIFISGEGIAIDCVISDFISGAVEQLAPENNPDHWQIIEGQGSLFHPAFAGVSLGLLHGAQADALIMCHVINRAHMRGIPGRDLPQLQETISMNLQAARLTNDDAKFVGISVNTSSVGKDEAEALCQLYSETFNLPCVDSMRHGVSKIVDELL